MCLHVRVDCSGKWATAAMIGNDASMMGFPCPCAFHEGVDWSGNWATAVMVDTTAFIRVFTKMWNGLGVYLPSVGRSSRTRVSGVAHAIMHNLKNSYLLGRSNVHTQFKSSTKCSLRQKSRKTEVEEVRLVTANFHISRPQLGYNGSGTAHTLERPRV